MQMVALAQSISQGQLSRTVYSVLVSALSRCPLSGKAGSVTGKHIFKWKTSRIFGDNYSRS